MVTVTDAPRYSLIKDQCPALPRASSNLRNSASRLNDAGFWRGGNDLNSSISPATIACIAYNK
jgi:hypothetical protein